MPVLTDMETALRIQAEATVANLRSEPASVRRTVPKHPHGWEPGIEFDGTVGRITSPPLSEPGPDWSALLERWDMDPSKFEVLEPVQVRTWDSAIGNGEVRTMWYYRANVRLRGATNVDVAELLAEVRKHRPAKHPPGGSAECPPGQAFVVAPADWQLGKEGTAITVARILADIDAIEARIKELRKIGRRIGSIYATLMGDTFESCDGNYDMQTFQVELDRRSQIKLGRQLLVKLLQRLAPLAPRIVVAAVGGNHTENRKDGKAYTAFGDSDDLAVAEQVQEILAANPETYGHVSFVIPDNELTLTLDAAGTILGLTHGHSAKGGGPSAEAKLVNWWRGQMHGRRPVGDADILIAAHFHHLGLVSEASRTLFLCPTLESRSQWVDETTGKTGMPGTLTFLTANHEWSDLQVV